MTSAAPLRFLLNGEPVAVSDLSPQTTLLEYLRNECRLTGTKEGCAEGDCGACTVVIAERAGDGAAALRWRAVNACIRLLPSVAGKAVYTVEALQHEDGTLHPVQNALVECHGSQCGFCTPGFVMSLFALYKNASRPSRDAIDDALSGNLCRCTGYRPIVEAAQRMYDAAALPEPQGWRGRGCSDEGEALASPEEAALAHTLAALPAVPEYAAAGCTWFAPRSSAALSAVLASHPGARIVAGATDVALWITKQHRDLGDIVYVGEAADLLRIGCDASGLRIGAAVTLEDAFAALVEQWPELRETWIRFASVPIRTSGTLGGNIANGSPIGDSMPALMALDARVVLQRGSEVREVPLAQFYVAYQKSVLLPAEFVAAVNVPAREPSLLLRAYKISKRFDQDISAVFAAFALRLDGERITGARIACGGVAATPRRATATEAELVGRVWNPAAAAAAAATLVGEFAPIDDMRASAAYRRRVLGNLMHRFALETAVVPATQAPATEANGTAHATRIHALASAR